MNQYLEFSDGSSHKFWSVSTEDCTVTVVFGKIGTAGQTQIKEFGSSEEAEKQAQRQAASKIAKGYAPATPPETIGAGSDAAAKSAKKPAAPKAAPKAGKIPADVADDGTLQPWHQEESDFWEYSWHCCDEESFAIEALMKPEEESGEKKATPAATPKAEESDESKPKKPLLCWGTTDDGSLIIAGADDDDDDDDDDDIAYNFGRSFSNAAQKYTTEQMIEKWEAGKRAGLSESALQAALDKGVDRILTWTLYPNGMQNLAWLMAQGAKLDIDSSDAPFAQCFASSFKATKDGAKATETLDKFLHKAYDKMAIQLASGLRTVIEALTAGTIEEGSGIKYLPDEEQMATLSGLELRTYQTRAYISPLLNEHRPDEILQLRYSETDDVDDEVAAQYLPQKLRPLIEQLAAEGLFDKFPACQVSIRYHQGETFYEKILDQNTYDAMVAEAEAMIQSFETTEEFELYAPLLPQACHYLAKVVKPLDVPRMSKLIGRFLYSLNSDAEEKANDMLCRYDDDFVQLQYDRALWLQANGDFRPAHNVMGFADDRGYAPAGEKLKEFDQLAEQRALTVKSATGIKKPSGRKKVSFAQFAEADLFVNTDTIIARADSDGTIRLRFKIEGEAGYSEALDYLINLLEKGYARLDDGYLLEARLLRKPEFIKQLPGFPKNTCHAFFAAAVKFPALREKVRRYADLALVEFDWYKDLDGEENTVPGTFAACALAFCDEQYIHMAGQYARVSDNEHQYIQLEVAAPLVKTYGAIPAVAKAIFDISCSNGQDGEMGRLPKTLWELPENLAAVMEHIEDGTALQHHVELHVIKYVEAIMGDDVKRNLKKIVIAAKAASADDQRTFEEFYNTYKNYAAEYENEDYGNDLNLTAKSSSSKVPVPVYEEGEPVVVSMEEFHKLYPDRQIEFTGDDGYAAEPLAILFIPEVIDNPYIMDYTLTSWKLGSKVAREIPVSFFWYPCTIQLGDWVINLTAPAKQYGAILYDGKKKPYVVYGKFNIVQLFMRFSKRPFKSAEDAELARLASLLEEAPDCVPVPKEHAAAAKKYELVSSALAVERHYAAGAVLPTFTPADGMVYDAALIQRGILAHRLVDPVTEKAIYEELSERLPQYAEYWEDKLRKL